MTESTEIPSGVTTGTSPSSPDPDFAPNVVRLYVCPACKGWYGSSRVPDLEHSLNRRTSMRNAANEDSEEWGKVTGPRSICQVCQARTGESIERVLVEYVRKDRIVQTLEEQVELRYKEEEKASKVKIARAAPNS